jgi:hypothetical protein
LSGIDRLTIDGILSCYGSGDAPQAPVTSRRGAVEACPVSAGGGGAAESPPPSLRDGANVVTLTRSEYDRLQTAAAWTDDAQY